MKRSGLPARVAGAGKPDALLPGLYLVIQPSGARSFAVRYRHHGKPRKHTLGSYPIVDLKTARELGTKALRAAAEGRDPAKEKRKERATIVKDVVAQFIAKHGQRWRPRTHKEYQRLLARFVLAPWGNRPIGSITRPEVRDVLDKIIANGTPILANRAHGAIGTLFGWAVEQEIIAASPTLGLKAPAVKEKPRDRILNDDELRSVWRATKQLFRQVHLSQRYRRTEKTINNWKRKGLLPPPDMTIEDIDYWYPETIEANERERFGAKQSRTEITA
jgi:hypothetical protein